MALGESSGDKELVKLDEEFVIFARESICSILDCK
jgi:hypothetical protein